MMEENRTEIPEEELLAWEKRIANFTFPKWNELPEIDLYMDQVVGYLTQKLSAFSECESRNGADPHTITPAMINNYVKQKLIEAPVKKRYDRAKLSELMILFCVKQVLSIGQCGDFLAVNRMTSGDPEQAYTVFCTAFERVLKSTFSGEALPDPDAFSTVMITTAIAFVNKLYAEKLLSIAAAMLPKPEKQEKKEPKKAEKKSEKN